MIRAAALRDAPHIVRIWREAVEATHDFLHPDDLTRIDAEVREHLPAMVSWVWIDADDQTSGFIAMTGAHIDALFVDPARHRGGVGRALIDHVRADHRVLTVDVNEQNPRATGFYERLGFRRTGRSATDDQGRPYAWIHMSTGG